jgi:hypothetical protein
MLCITSVPVAFDYHDLSLLTVKGVAQTLLNSLVTKNDFPILAMSLRQSNQRLPPGASHLKMSEAFFESTPKSATMADFILWHSEVVLFKVLSEDRFRLWSLFVKCCRLFFAHELTENLINEVETSYEQFVREYITIFCDPTSEPRKKIPFNFHLGLHIAENLRTFGPSFTSWW